MVIAVKGAADLHVLSAGSTLHGLRPCTAAFTLATAIPVSVATDHAHTIQDEVFRSAVDADVILLPVDMVAALAAAGLVAREPVAALGHVGIGGAVPAAAPPPDISTMEKLSSALLSASGVLLTHAPTGDHLLEVIDRLGLTGAVAGKLRRFGTATQLAAHLATSPPNTIGFAPETEIRGWQHGNPGQGHVTWAGPVPDEIQIALPYAAAMLTTTRAPEAARALLEFLSTAEARNHFQASGVR